MKQKIVMEIVVVEVLEVAVEIVVDEVHGIHDIGFAYLNVRGSASNHGKICREDSASVCSSVMMKWRSDLLKTKLNLLAPVS